MEISDGVRQATKRLVDVGGVEAVILFGDRARGEFLEDSRWDLCVLLRGDAREAECAASVLSELVADCGEAITVHPVPRSEYDSTKFLRKGRCHDVVRDGYVIFSRA